MTSHVKFKKCVVPLSGNDGGARLRCKLAIATKVERNLCVTQVVQWTTPERAAEPTG